MAVLAFGLAGGCGSDGGGEDGEDRDAGEDDGGDAGSTRPMRDSGIDASEEDDAEADACISTIGCDDLEAEGVECGHPLDNCGEPLDCGGDEKCVDPDDPATEYFTCGGGGEFKCGCTPRSCDEELICGTLDDGCGGEIECGDECEDEHHTCGARRPYECGCAPNLSACGNAQCGTADDDCGGTVQCGSHDGGCSDARTCNASKQCECKPQAELCEGKCGKQTLDGCPTVDCGACAEECGPDEACGSCSCPGAGAVCANDACCTPEPLATTCGTAVCGTKVNNCGQTVTCGTGSCAGGQQCTSGGQCVDAKTAALIGRYAVRSIGFAYASGQGSRSEGYSLVDIVSQGDQLVMREKPCASLAFAKIGSSREIAEPAAAITPTIASQFPVIETVLDLSGTKNVPGVKEWFRNKQSLVESSLGWRPGRPSYCPAPTAEVPRPSPSSALPGYDAPDGRGAKKPWLNGADCKCPEEEVAQPKRDACSSATTPPGQVSACMADWLNLSVPYQPNEVSADEDVTDCRVIDEDGDGKPGVTIEANAPVGRAKLHAASVIANYLYGDVDESGARKHKGVLMDLPETRNTVMACVDPEGLGSFLCSSSVVSLCPPVRSDGSRSNPVDFVPLETQQPPGGGTWTCEAVYENKDSLFMGVDNFRNNYPPASICMVPM